MRVFQLFNHVDCDRFAANHAATKLISVALRTTLDRLQRPSPRTRSRPIADPAIPKLTVTRDPQRRRVRMTPLVEAGARLGFGYLRNQYGLRDRRPPGTFLRRTASFLAARGRTDKVEVEMAGLRVLVSTADRTIARSVYTSGDWDPLLVGTVFRALNAAGEPYRGRTFLEVGANFGVYALPAVAQLGFARAVAYEPDPSSFGLLARNIERNGLGDRVTAYNAALSAQAGELTLRLGKQNAGDNRIVAGSAAGEAGTVSVPARTFDDEVAAGRIPVDDLGLVWLDVQGHEREVLLGARSLLASPAPLVLEYATAMMDDRTRRVMDELIADCFDIMVDIGWCTLTDRIRFQPASAVRGLVADGRAIETDLLLLHHRSS